MLLLVSFVVSKRLLITYSTCLLNKKSNYSVKAVMLADASEGLDAQMLVYESGFCV